MCTEPRAAFSFFEICSGLGLNTHQKGFKELERRKSAIKSAQEFKVSKLAKETSVWLKSLL